MLISLQTLSRTSPLQLGANRKKGQGKAIKTLVKDAQISYSLLLYTINSLSVDALFLSKLGPFSY